MISLRNTVIFICAALIVIAFFLPWVNLQSKEMGMISSLLSGEKKDASLLSISAFEVPIMANSEESKLILMVARLFKPGIKDVDTKSYLIWVVPLSALIIVLLRLFLSGNKILNLVLGIIGCLIFAVAMYKLKTVDLAKPGLQVRIAVGVWLMLWAYLVIGITSVIEYLRLRT